VGEESNKVKEEIKDILKDQFEEKEIT